MWSKLKEQFNLLKLEKKRLYLVTNSDKFESKDIFLDAVASALQGGVDIIQLREKNAPDGVIVDLGSKIRMLCDEYGATFRIVDSAFKIEKPFLQHCKSYPIITLLRSKEKQADEEVICMYSKNYWI